MILAALGGAAMLSLAIGSNPLSIAEVWHGLWTHDDSTASAVVWGLRGPRTVVGLIVGAALGVAGALIQALTRNPLADPGILGVNAGAGFAVTLGAGVLGLTSVTDYVWFAFAGAAVATLLVYLIGSAGRLRPTRRRWCWPASPWARCSPDSPPCWNCSIPRCSKR